jgi:hypothetical protein
MTAKRPDPTAAKRQAAKRARAKDAGLAEVRGILAPPALHPNIKAAAWVLIRKRAKAKPKEPT